MLTYTNICLNTHPPLEYLLNTGAPAPALSAAQTGSAFDLSALQYGKEVALSKYAGQVVVVVNVASA